VDGKVYFGVRHVSSVQKSYFIKPHSLSVFWDVSFSGRKREIEEEVSFIRQYIAYYGITELTIVPFNTKAGQAKHFHSPGSDPQAWIHYVHSFNYEGATRIDNLDFAFEKADVIFLVTDGNLSLGSPIPRQEKSFLFCIHASPIADNNALNAVVGNSGGKNIDLLRKGISEAISLAGAAENKLLRVYSASGRTIIDAQYFDEHNNESIIAGTMQTSTDTLIFEYGNNNKISAKEKTVIGTDFYTADAIDRIPALIRVDGLIKNLSWQGVLSFGKAEKIVTPYTSFIVLEKATDYIKFNIEPPKDLEEECEKIQPGFNVFNSRQDKLKKSKQLREFEILSGVAGRFNERIRKWGSEDWISLKQPDINSPGKTTDKNILAAGVPGGSALVVGRDIQFGGEQAMTEVVVTGYNTMAKRSLSSSVSITRANGISWLLQLRLSRLYRAGLRACR
jgi:hypothetical protein